MSSSLKTPKLYRDISPDGSQMLSTNNVARILKVPPSRLRTWRSRNLGPAFVRMLNGKQARVLYRMSDIAAFIEASVAITKRMPKPMAGRMPTRGRQ